MLIIDPIVSAVSGDSHKNTEVRRALQPVVDLAAETGCAVYGITHFTKGTAGRDPVDRVTGSLAFGALTRIVTVALKMPEEGSHPPGAWLFARAKSNIGPDGGGFYYRLEERENPDCPGLLNACVTWGESVGQCESCPAAGFWDNIKYARQGMLCFFDAFYRGKSGKPKPCTNIRSQCPRLNRL
jgi:putative DNA primase/helicase